MIPEIFSHEDKPSIDQVAISIELAFPDHISDHHRDSSRLLHVRGLHSLVSYMTREISSSHRKAKLINIFRTLEANGFVVVVKEYNHWSISYRDFLSQCCYEYLFVRRGSGLIFE